MWHKPCRTFHPWCLCIKTRCLFWYCGCSSVSLGLNWKRSHIYRIDRRHANHGTALKTCHLLLRLTCIFSQVVGVFHMVYCDDKKKTIVVLNMSWKTSRRRYTNQIAFLLLSLTELILLAINISISYMAKDNGFTSFIYFELEGYIPITENKCPKEGTDCIWGFTPLNTSFMTQ